MTHPNGVSVSFPFLVVMLHLTCTLVALVWVATSLLPLHHPDALRVGASIHFAAAFITFIGTLHTAAPYGRHAAIYSTKLRLPAPLAWALQESPTLWNVMYHVLWESLNRWEGGRAWHVGIWLFAAHYAHRALWFPFFLRHGTDVPWEVTLSASVYCLLNGRLQVLANVRATGAMEAFPFDSNERMLGLLVGLLLFGVGMFVNVCADYKLLRLRSTPPVGIYKIPNGGLFDWVCCPNFFGEMVEWFGYAIVVRATATTWQSERVWAAFSFAVYVVSNLIPRAKAHHEWYEKKFGTKYTALKRRVVIPCIY